MSIGWIILTVFFSQISSVETISIRLTNNPPNSGPHWGRVEVSQVTDVWGTVDATGWTDNDAIVVCKQLSYATGKASRASNNNHRNVFMRNPGCVGTETDITSCNGATISDYGEIGSSRYAAVICYNDAGPQLRLNPGPNYGLVEVSVNGEWGTICHHNGGYEWRRANVICKHLGFHSGYGYYLEKPKQKTGTNSQPIWMHDARCSGSESNLFSCPHYGWGTGWTHCHDRHRSDMNIMCFNNVNSVYLETAYNHGRINYWLKGQNWKWKKQICDDGWDDQDAKVACKSMGFTGGKATTHGIFQPDWWGASFGMSKFECTGDEESLWDCPHVNTGSCASHSDKVAMSTAGAICYDVTETYDVTVGIKDGSWNTGKFAMPSLNYYNSPGIICDPNWTAEDALVTCKTYESTIGYTTFDTGIPLCCGIARDAGDRTPRWKKHINCTGNEASLTDCPMDSQWGVPYPECKSRDSEVAVVCYSSTRTYGNDYRLTLVHTSVEQGYGHLLINYKDHWGFISADPGTWTDVEATVACRQLELNGVKIWHGGISAPGRMWRHWDNRAQWLKNVTCQGTEDKLADCSYAAGYGDNFWIEDRDELHAQGRYNYMSHDKDVGVVCYAENEDLFANWQVSVRKGLKFPGQTFGLAYVHYARLDGTICSDGFDDNDAKVVCREAGYMNGLKKPYYAQRSTMIWMNNLECDGTEQGVRNCTHAGFGGHATCEQHHTDYGDAGVFCFDSEEYYEEYRLNGGRSNYGYLELDFAGYLGTVCHSYWGWQHSKAVCQEFGYPYDYGRVESSGRAGKGIGPVYLVFSHDACPPAGPDFNLFDCPQQRGFGWTHCSNNHNYDAGVFCYDNYDRCQGVKEISADEGIVKTSYQDHNYYKDSRCEWKITVPAPYRVVLTFYKFDVASSQKCREDFLLVYEGHNTIPKNRLTKRVCGNTKPDPIRSRTNKMTVKFNSNENTERRGFIANFYKECPGLDMMMQTATVTNITGKASKKFKYASIDRCTIECDKDSYCYEMYYDETNNDCYLKMHSYHGRNWDLTNIIVSKYERQCMVCKKVWYASEQGVILVNKLNKTISAVGTLHNCKVECEATSTCVSISYSASKKMCVLNFATPSENGNASLSIDAAYEYIKVKCKGGEATTCAQLKRRHPKAIDGWYPLTINNVLTPVYCDMTSGGWMTVLKVFSDNWTTDKLQRVSRPSLVDYSILAVMDKHVRGVSQSDYYRYRIDATDGTCLILTSRLTNSLLAENTCQSDIDLHTNCGTNQDQTRIDQLTECVPYSKTAEGILTTTSNSNDGALTKPSQGLFTLSIKEVTSSWRTLYSPCKRYSKGMYDITNDTYTCQCRKNTHGQYCENRINGKGTSTSMQKGEGRIIFDSNNLLGSTWMSREMMCITHCDTFVELKSINFKPQDQQNGNEANCECLSVEKERSKIDHTQSGWKNL